MTNTIRDRAIALGVVLLVGWWGSCNARRSGRLEGQIDGWKQSAAQLGNLAAAKRKSAATTHAAFLAGPSLETCRPALGTCGELNAALTDQLEAKDKEIGGLKKLKGRDKILGILPRPVIGPGACISIRFRPEFCAAVIIPLR